MSCNIQIDVMYDDADTIGEKWEAIKKYYEEHPDERPYYWNDNRRLASEMLCSMKDRMKYLAL